MFSQAGRSSNSPLKAGRWRMLQEVVCRFLEVLLQSTKGQKLLGNPFLQTWKTQVWNVNIWMRSHHTNTLGVEHPKKTYLMIKVGVMRSHYKRRYFVLGHSRTSSPKTHVIFPRWSLSRSSALCAVLPGGTTKHSCEHVCEDEVVSKMLNLTK